LRRVGVIDSSDRRFEARVRSAIGNAVG